MKGRGQSYENGKAMKNKRRRRRSWSLKQRLIFRWRVSLRCWEDADRKKKKRTNQSLLPFLPSNFLLVLPNGRNKEQDSWQRKSPSITEIQSWKRTVDYLKLIPALAFLFFFNGDKLSLPLLCPPLLISILAFPLLKLKRHFHIFDHTVTHKHPTIKILSPA